MMPGGIGPVGLGAAAHTVASNTATIARNSRNSRGHISGQTLEELEREQREKERNERVNELMLEDLKSVALFFGCLFGIMSISIFIMSTICYFLE